MWRCGGLKGGKPLTSRGGLGGWRHDRARADQKREEIGGHPLSTGQPRGAWPSCRIAQQGDGGARPARETHGKDILQKRSRWAKDGDLARRRSILVPRLARPEGPPVTLELPPIETAADIVSALGEGGRCRGRWRRDPGRGIGRGERAGVKRRTIETADLESRISALEKERSK